jgi:hypothetical protein
MALLDPGLEDPRIRASLVARWSHTGGGSALNFTTDQNSAWSLGALDVAEQVAAASLLLVYLYLAVAPGTRSRSQLRAVATFVHYYTSGGFTSTWTAILAAEDPLRQCCSRCKAGPGRRSEALHHGGT